MSEAGVVGPAGKERNLNHFPLPNLGLPQKNTTFALPHYALVVEW